jgi:hypothetical protein
MTPSGIEAVTFRFVADGHKIYSVQQCSLVILGNNVKFCKKKCVISTMPYKILICRIKNFKIFGIGKQQNMKICFLRHGSYYVRW